MNKAFVETTILTDALLKPGPRANTARRAIASFPESLFPVYAIKEFKAGPLRSYVWLHGKLVTTKSLQKTIEAIRRTSASPFGSRRVSTSLEALESAAQKNHLAELGTLAEKYGSLASFDSVVCDRYRLALRSIIKRGWGARRKLTSRVVDELSCYAEGELLEEYGLFELGEVDCEPKDECSLATRLRQNPEKLRLMLAVIDVQGGRAENIKRAQVLRDLIRDPNRKLMNKQCRHLGDAIFAFFCPPEATILTTNERDLRPLAEALGKKLQVPSDQ